MFRAARCSSSGGKIVSPQPLVSSASVNSGTVCRWRPEAVVIQFVLLRMSSVLFKHVEDRSVTYILLKNEGIVH